MFLKPSIPLIGADPRQTIALVKRIGAQNFARSTSARPHQVILRFEPSELEGNVTRRLKPLAR